MWALLGTAKKAEDDTSGGPIVVLMKVGAERGPVVVDVEHTDFPMAGRVGIQTAAHFLRQTVRCRGGAARARSGGIFAGGPAGGLRQHRGPPTTSAPGGIKPVQTYCLTDK